MNLTDLNLLDSRIGDKGYFVAPTVFADVTDNMKIAVEEVKYSGFLLWNFIPRHNDKFLLWVTAWKIITIFFFRFSVQYRRS